MEKIKTGMYIQKECKENIDKLKSFDVKPNEFFDKILKFNNDGLLLYLDLVCKFNNLKYATYDKNDTFITNDPDIYEKVSAISGIPKMDALDLTNDFHNENLIKSLDFSNQTLEDRVTKLETKIEKQQYHIDTLLRSLAIVVNKLKDKDIIKS